MGVRSRKRGGQRDGILPRDEHVTDCADQLHPLRFPVALYHPVEAALRVEAVADAG